MFIISNVKSENMKIVQNLNYFNQSQSSIANIKITMSLFIL